MAYFNFSVSNINMFIALHLSVKYGAFEHECQGILLKSEEIRLKTKCNKNFFKVYFYIG